MAFTRPTFSTILARIQADINSNLPGADSRLRRSVLNTIAFAMAGAVHNFYGLLFFLSVQIFPDTAETDFLNRWGAIYGLARLPAASATGNVVFTGTDTTDIPLGTQVQRSDLALFLTTADGVISGSSATIAVSAKTPGLAGNTTASSVFTLTTPISGINGSATVDGSGLNHGTDLESDSSYSSRILDRIQQPPQGGSNSDYVAWAMQVAQVTRAWCYPQGGGSPNVTVYFMMDQKYTNGIPLSGDVTDVQNYMDPLIPVTADLTVAAPIATTQAFTIHLIQNDTSDIRAAVAASLQDLITRESVPAGTIYLSQFTQAINLTANVFASVMSVPSADVTAASGHITTLGSITWI